MLAGDGQYCPTVLRGRLKWGHQLWGEDAGAGIYRLVLVKDGQHHLEVAGNSYQVTPGQIYLLQPMAHQSSSATLKSDAILIAFTVTSCELERRPGSKALDLVDDHHRQPSPREIWGIDLPVVLPQELSAKLADLMQAIVAMWWRNRWNHYRANVRLVELLDILVEHQQRGIATPNRKVMT